MPVGIVVAFQLADVGVGEVREDAAHARPEPGLSPPLWVLSGWLYIRGPIRGQYQGHVTSIDQSEARIHRIIHSLDIIFPLLFKL